MIAGIDLGTTHSLIGVMDAGFPVLLADAEGDRLTPSVVHYPEGAPAFAGKPAARMRALAPERTITSIKRFMGRRFAELDPAELAVPCQVVPDRAGALRLRLPDGTSLRPEDVSAQILAKLKGDAETAMGESVARAVITVPAYFNDAQRNATKAAGEQAGFAVERILNEPTAAALACGLGRGRARCRVAVYDFGGGTFDISILEQHGDVFQVASTCGNTRLGGDDMDRALVEVLLAEWDLSAPPSELLARIFEAAVAAKHRLSTADSTRIEIPFAPGGKNLACDLSRARLETLARPMVERTRPACLRALADAGLTPGDLDEVLLVGGATRMPVLRDFVADFFGRDPVTTQNPDEAVAAGATLQAGILSGAVRDVVLLDVTPLSLGIETFGGLMNVIIPRNSTLPIKAGEMFTNAVAGQSAMDIHILQGERELARDNWSLGRFDLPFPPAPKGKARVGVQFEIDADGILHVLARDTATGHEQTLTLKSAVDVGDEEVERMIAESVEHAFDDMSQRVLAEAGLKSREMLRGVRLALQRIGGGLPEEERRNIEALAAEVETAIAEADPGRLKKANAALDEGTQSLAALLMDQAMENALKRRGLTASESGETP